MDLTNKRAILRFVLPQVPFLTRTAIWHTLYLSSTSTKWDLKTELIVKLLREVLSTPNPRGALAQQRASLKVPPIKGKIWIAKTTIPTSDNDDVLQLLCRAIDDLRTSPSQTYTAPHALPVEAEWTGYRQNVDSQRQRPDFSEQQHYDRLISDTTTPVTILYFHGGAFIMMDPATHRNPVSHLTRLTGGRALSIRYRLAPQHAFPAALLDCLIAYFSLLYPPPGSFHTPVDPSKIVLAGDSAGGNLAFALTQSLLQINRSSTTNSTFTFHGHTVPLPVPVPTGLATHSPYVDQTGCLPSRLSNAQFDYLPPPLDKQRLSSWPKDEIWPSNPPRGDPYCETEMLRHPLVSPTAAQDWTGAGPMFVACGEEMLADEAMQAVALASRQGVSVRWEQWEAMCHCFGMIFIGSAMSKRFFKDWADFVRRVCGVEEEGGGKAEIETGGVFFEAKTMKEREIDVKTMNPVTQEELDERMKEAVGRRRRSFDDGTKVMPKL